MDLGLALFLSIGALALFTFLAVMTFVDARARERTEYHRSETLRKVADQSGEGADKILEVIREEQRVAQRKRIEGLKLGGLITTMAGVGTFLFFRLAEPEMMGVAAIPFLIGLSLLLYVFVLAPNPDGPRKD